MTSLNLNHDVILRLIYQHLIRNEHEYSTGFGLALNEPQQISKRIGCFFPRHADQFGVSITESSMEHFKMYLYF